MLWARERVSGAAIIPHAQQLSFERALTCTHGSALTPTMRPRSSSWRTSACHVCTAALMAVSHTR